MTVTALDVLVRARELIEQGWCQFDFAQTADGGEAGSFSEAADRFCAWGAIRRAVWDLHAGKDWLDRMQIKLEQEATRALAHVISERGYMTCPGGTVSNWNDETGRLKQDVLEAYDRAIEQEKNRASMA